MLSSKTQTIKIFLRDYFLSLIIYINVMFILIKILRER